MKTSPTLLAAALVLLPFAASAVAVEQLDEEVERSRQQLQGLQSGQGQAQPAGQAEQIRALESAIRRGEAASTRLKDEIKQQEAISERLKGEVARLEKVQTVLTSGLLGALATTVVALMSLFANSKKSHADRDFRRLEVIEKARQLQASGVSIPEDIKDNYVLATRDA